MACSFINHVRISLASLGNGGKGGGLTHFVLLVAAVVPVNVRCSNFTNLFCDVSRNIDRCSDPSKDKLAGSWKVKLDRFEASCGERD